MWAVQLKWSQVICPWGGWWFCQRGPQRWFHGRTAPRSWWKHEAVLSLTATLQSQRVTASCLARSTSQACSHWCRRELLQFQCFLHPAVAVDSLIESDGVKHNKKDDLMGLLLKPFCNFHYQKKSLLEWYPLLSKCFLKAKIQGMQSTPAVSA